VLLVPELAPVVPRVVVVVVPRPVLLEVLEAT
jgi:hypothetical protein